MHVVRIRKNKFSYTATIIEKIWDNELLSNQISILANKNFIFYFFAKRWAKNKIIEILKTNNKLEFING